MPFKEKGCRIQNGGMKMDIETDTGLHEDYKFVRDKLLETTQELESLRIEHARLRIELDELKLKSEWMKGEAEQRCPA